MTFPESQRVVYAEHTLSQVVCQLNFPPILAIGTEPPAALQDRLRDQYPLYETIPGAAGPLQMAGAPQELTAMIAQLPFGQAQPVQHRFTTADEARSIILGPRLLAIEDTAYSEWALFRSEVEAVRTALEEIYHPAFYTRIGLRYQNVVDRSTLSASATWTDAINPAFLGLLGVAQSEIKDAVTEIAGGVLVQLDEAEQSFVRINHGLATNSDSPDQVVYLIDSDFFTQARKEGSEVYGLLDYFNGEAGKLFRWVITDALRDALGRRDDVSVSTD